MNEQLLKDNEAERSDKNEAMKVLNALHGLTKDKRQIVVASACAYIDGMKTGSMLSDKEG